MFKRLKQHNKDIIHAYLRQRCLGFRKAKKRHIVLRELPIDIDDRVLRRIVSELRAEGHVASHHSLGYWAVPLHTNDPQEIEALIKAQHENKSKALSMLKGIERDIRALEERKKVATGRQLEFQGV